LGDRSLRWPDGGAALHSAAAKEAPGGVHRQAEHRRPDREVHVVWHPRMQEGGAIPDPDQPPPPIEDAWG